MMEIPAVQLDNISAEYGHERSAENSRLLQLSSVQYHKFRNDKHKNHVDSIFSVRTLHINIEIVINLANSHDKYDGLWSG